MVFSTDPTEDEQPSPAVLVEVLLHFRFVCCSTGHGRWESLRFVPLEAPAMVCVTVPEAAIVPPEYLR